MNKTCIKIIQSMEQVRSSIYTFSGALFLQGKTYQTAKAYMTATYLPLAQGMIYLCEELIRQNDLYPNEFRLQVGTADVIENEVRAQMDQIDAQIERCEQFVKILPIFALTIFILNQMRRKLEQKLQDLYDFNTTSRSNFNTALEFSHSLIEGLVQVQNGNGFNKNDGTFSTAGMNLDFIAKIEQTNDKRKAYSAYGDYLEEFPNNINKVIEIMKYEMKHPEHADSTSDLLSSLDERDSMDIKYLMYTADEPYRTLTFQYVDRLEIIREEIDPDKDSQPSYFTTSKNTITYVYERDRTNARGIYFTFFHELGHAIDYNYGIDEGNGGFYTDLNPTDGKSLALYMREDVENKIREELENELNRFKYSYIEEHIKNSIVENVSKSFIYKEGPPDINLSSEERHFYLLMRRSLSSSLSTDEDHNASDVYGGVTVNIIKGKWAHHQESYWIDTKTKQRTLEPNREGFGHYYASIILKNEQHIESVEEYLPLSKEYMDEIFKQMSEGENE